MSAGMMLISVVRRGRGDRVVAIAKAAGAKGSTVLLGRGTAQNRWLLYLGLADTEKELVFTIASREEMPPIIAALRDSPDICSKVPGIGFTLDVSYFLHSGKIDYKPVKTLAHSLGGDNMGEHELICVITNYGFADDIMHAARAAGAKGGTIIKARGTGTEEDSSFFGITIVPEKEMLMILARRDESLPIMEAVRNCSCLATPGVGIVFCMPVENFFPLGKKANSQ